MPFPGPASCSPPAEPRRLQERQGRSANHITCLALQRGGCLDGLARACSGCLVIDRLSLLLNKKKKEKKRKGKKSNVSEHRLLKRRATETSSFGSMRHRLHEQGPSLTPLPPLGGSPLHLSHHLLGQGSWWDHAKQLHVSCIQYATHISL